MFFSSDPEGRLIIYPFIEEEKLLYVASCNDWNYIPFIKEGGD